MSLVQPSMYGQNVKSLIHSLNIGTRLKPMKMYLLHTRITRWNLCSQAILSKALRDQDYLILLWRWTSSSNITDLNLTIAKPSEANFSGTVKDPAVL